MEFYIKVNADKQQLQDLFYGDTYQATDDELIQKVIEHLYSSWPKNYFEEFAPLQLS